MAGRRKVAFVAPRCGREVVGGAEALCLSLAKRLSVVWDTEVLTTRALDYMTWADHYPEGVEEVDGARVRRFPVDAPRDVARFDALSARIVPKIPACPQAEFDDWMAAQGPVSSALRSYIVDNERAFDAFFFMPYVYATTYSLLPLVASKAFVAPCAHDEWPIRFDAWDEFFQLPQGFVFNTPEERDYFRRRFPDVDPVGVVGSFGIDPPTDFDPGRFRKATGVDSPFLLYVGRIDEHKGCREMFEHFIRYKERNPGPLRLVLIGKDVLGVPTHPDITFLGFVDERTKRDAMAACSWLLNFSPYESLSIVLLEAWSVGRPTLVTERSEAMLGQTKRSDGGLWFADYAEFEHILRTIPSAAMERLGAQGHRFVSETCTWNAVVERFQSLVP